MNTVGGRAFTSITSPFKVTSYTLTCHPLATLGKICHVRAKIPINHLRLLLFALTELSSSEFH